MNWQTVHGTSSENGSRTAEHTITVVGGVSGTGPKSDLFDQFDSALGHVADAAMLLDDRLDSVAEAIEDKLVDASIELAFKGAVTGANWLIDQLDPDNNVDLNPAGDLIWGVTAVTRDFVTLAKDLYKPSLDKSDVVLQSIQLFSSLVSLANKVRHVSLDEARQAPAELLSGSPAELSHAIVSQVAHLAVDTGVDSVMKVLPSVSKLGAKLKGFVEKSSESDEVLEAGTETKTKTALAKEYIETGAKIAEHVDAILDELFGPDDLYVDKDGVERRWSANQRREPTPGKDNVTTGSGDDTVVAGQGNDKIQTNTGNDHISAGVGDNRVDAGAGDDFISDGDGDSFLTAGRGADVVEDGGGNDVINLGRGIDTLIYRGPRTGRDLVYDSGRSGEIHLLAISESDLSYTKQGSDLAISIESSVAALKDEIRIVDFFRNESTNWTLRTKDNPAVDLRRITGRISHTRAARLALQSYADVSTYQSDLPTGLTHATTITDFLTGLHAELFVDSSTGDRQAYVVIRGSEPSLQDWLINNAQAGLPQANVLLDALNATLPVEQLQSITLIGHSAGGMVAQWIGTHFASRQVPFVNVTTINSPEISGRIQNASVEAFPEFAYGLPSLSTTHIVHPDDPVSKIGIWAGRGLGTSTWVTWTQPDRTTPMLSISGLLDAHTPDVNEFSGGNVEFTTLTPEQVQRHVGLRSVSDATQFLYRVDAATSTTRSLFDLLLASGRVDLVENHEAALQEEATFRQSLAHDPHADLSFSASFDFGPRDSNLEPGHTRISETTLYATHAGWLEVNDDLKSRDRGRATDLNRDFVATSGNTFVVDLPTPGTYNLSFVTGDRSEIRESMVFYVNGFYYDTVSTMPGQFLTHGFQITTSDPQLQIEIKDRGGQTDRAVINGLSVEKVPYGIDAPASTIVQDDESVVILTHGYTVPGWIEEVGEIIKQTVQAAKDVAAVAGAYGRGGIGLAVLKTTEISLRRIREELTKDRSVRATSRVHDWVFDAAESFAAMSRRFRLGQLDSNVIPVDFGEVFNAIQSGKSDKQLLRLWKGSRDFLALDWTDESSKGSGVFDLIKGDFSEEDHRDAVEQGARIYKALIDAYIAKLQRSDPDRKLDLLLVSHSYGYNVNRELAERISYSETADHVDFLKVVTLDPVSMKPDELRGTKRQSDRLHWYHPELTPEVDAVDNYYQTEGVFHTKFTSTALAFGLVGVAVHELAGNIEDQIVFGKPLDGREGGGVAGFYNRQARLFDLESLDELLRFRHWDRNEISLTTAELTDIEFSPDGSLVAASGKDGIVTVRYVDDVPNPDPSVEQPLHSAGEVKFEVWGHESIVRSTAFMQLEVDGVWKDYLLTISAARNPENTDIDKNKVLLTDVETGLPVWQGKDVGGTQVEASPSGEIIVSTDSRGHAKIWRRVPGTVTYQPDETLVEAHPNGAYIADVYVISDEYFVTAGLDSKLKLFQISDDGAKLKWSYRFDNVGQGKVRNLDYDPYNGILAVTAGRELSFWRFDQAAGNLSIWSPTNASADNVFGRQDHTKTIQGVSFSKPAFLLDDAGNYLGDRHLPRTEAGDVDLEALQQFIEQNNLPDTLAGLKLVTGGEDRTLFLYALDDLDRGHTPKDSVLSGAMLPIREVTLAPDGRRVAVVGQDNVDDDFGGPVRDVNVTDEIDERLGFDWSEIFVGGLREHNEVPPFYLEDVVGVSGEAYFWQRNNDAASRSGDLDPERNLALPPNKRANKHDLDVDPIDLKIRPGQKIDIKPLRYLIEVDRQDYHIDESSLAQLPAVVRDAKDNVIGEIRQKKVDGKLRPNILVFEAVAELDFSEQELPEFSGHHTITLTGPEDAAGVARTVDAEITFRVINHKPILYPDVIELHPNRSERDFRPKRNDYDIDNDDFNLDQFPTAWQSLKQGNVVVARYRKTPDGVNGIDVETVVTAEQLQQLLDAQSANWPDGEAAPNYLSLTFPYQMREKRHKAVSTGTVEVRVQQQAGPAKVHATDVGADQLVLNWEPVSWSASKYVVQRYDFERNEWVKHSGDSDVSGRNADSKPVKNLQPETEYYFRVVAVNETSGRRHASFEGDGPGGFHVTTPDYVPVDRVTQEVLGSKQIEVSWSKVYWDVSKYEVQLRKLTVDADGNLQPETGNSFAYDAAETRRHDVVPGQNGGRGLSWTFKKLEPETWYQAAVVAKHGSQGVAKERIASFPVSTSSRLLPTALDVKRLGPTKVRVQWSKVTFADRYRIVAANPSNPLDTVSRTIAGFDARPGNTGPRSEILTGLTPNTEYVVFVEARDRHGNWSSILEADTTGRVVQVLDNTETPPRDSQIDLTSDLAATSQYLLPNDFATVLRLPTSLGAFVGTEAFRVFNLSKAPVTVEPFEGETVNGLETMTLQPAIGPNFNADDAGILVYRFVRGLDGWTVDIANDATAAVRVKTPDYLAAEPGTFKVHEEKSLPKRLHLEWESPFWNVSTHRVNLYKATLNDEGQPLESNGTFEHGLNVVARTSLIRVDEAADRFFGRELRGLAPATWYIAELVSKDANGREERLKIPVQTRKQSAPIPFPVEGIGLREFTAQWNAVDWNATGYRVRLEELDARGEVLPNSLRHLKAGDGKLRLKVEGLQPDRTYRYSIEARDHEGVWIPNSNSQEVRTARFVLPDNARLVLKEAGNRTITIDWANIFKTDNDGRRFAADAVKVTWTPVAGAHGETGQSRFLSGTADSYIIEKLPVDSGYEVSVEFTADVGGNHEALVLASPEPFRTLPIVSPTLSIPESEVLLRRFRVNWSHARLPDDGLQGYNLRISRDGGQTWKAAWNGSRSGMNLPPDRSTFDVIGFYTDAGETKRLEPDTDYVARLVAVYKSGDASNPTAIASIRTKPQSGVSDIVISDPGPDSFRVTWTHADNEGVDLYRVRVKQSGSGDWNSSHVIHDVPAPGPFEVTVSGRFAATKYDVQVRAIYRRADPDNGVKQIAIDEEATATTAPLPAITAFDVTDVRRVQADFSWQPPAGAKTLALEWTEGGQPKSQNVSGKTKATIDFQAGGRFPVTLIARAGNDQVTRVVTAEPIGYPAPGTPRLKPGTTPGRRQFEIEWDYTGDPISGLDEFRIVRSNGKLFGVASPESRSKVIKTRSSDRVNVTIEPGTEYELKIVAVYKNGTKISTAFEKFATKGAIPPTGVRATAIGSRQVTLTWQHADTTGVDFFRVRTSTDGGRTWTKVNGDVAPNQRTKTINNLMPDAPYQFQVAAVYRTVEANGVWEAGDSELIAVRTKDISTPQIRVVAARRKQLDVAWSGVSDWADWTKVQWRRVGASNWSGSGQLGGARTSYTIEDLNLETAYEVRVAAGGGGAQRESVAVGQTQGFVAPSSPSFSDVGATQIKVRWSHGDPAGAADGFAIYRDGKKVGDVSSSSREYLDKNLQPNRNYTYYVRAKYRLGSQDGTAASRRTAPISYVAATNLTASNVRKSKFNVSWKFSGDLAHVEKFTVRRANSTWIDTLFPASLPGRMDFSKVDLARTANSQWNILIRTHYIDGTTRDSVTIQLPKAGTSAASIASVTTQDGLPSTLLGATELPSHASGPVDAPKALQSGATPSEDGPAIPTSTQAVDSIFTDATDELLDATSPGRLLVDEIISLAEDLERWIEGR